MRVAVLQLAFAATSQAQWTTETVNLKGAYGLVIVPDDWNGSLFI